jgi:enediyne biosynthesis protein E4
VIILRSNLRLSALGIATITILALGPLLSAQKRQRATSTQPKAVVTYEDVTRAAGIDFKLVCGSSEKRYIMESLCGGVAFLDYDNDGWIDIFLVNGSTLEDIKSGKCHPSKLYRNNHDGTFTDTTSKAGLRHCRWGFGAAVGDYDNDGWPDLYVTNLDGGTLCRNNRDGTFSDATARAGVDNDNRWGTSAAFGDYDNDGLLDLYVTNYVELDLDHLPEFGSSVFCQYRGIPVSCGPRGLKGSRDHLYRNNGDGTFTDVSEKLGIDRAANYGLGVMWLDIDGDGCLDLYVADDSTPSLLYHNNCKGGLEEIGVQSGTAFSTDGKLQAGMGIDSADYDQDGLPDIAKTNFSDDSNNLYHNDGKTFFSDLAGPAGFGPISIPYLGFGVKFLDFDDDDWSDIIVANGHVNPQVDAHGFGITYAERLLVFRNRGNGTFEEIGARAGLAVCTPRVARGLAVADLWNDGRIAILMTVLDGGPVLLRNTATRANHSLRIKLVGTRSNRDGFGARLEVRSGGKTRYFEARSNSSYLAASDPRLHIGSGHAPRIDSLIVRWPSGVVDEIGPEISETELTVSEGRGVSARLAYAPSLTSAPKK